MDSGGKHGQHVTHLSWKFHCEKEHSGASSWSLNVEAEAYWNRSFSLMGLWERNTGRSEHAYLHITSGTQWHAINFKVTHTLTTVTQRTMQS